MQVELLSTAIRATIIIPTTKTPKIKAVRSEGLMGCDVGAGVDVGAVVVAFVVVVAVVVVFTGAGEVVANVVEAEA